MSDSELHYYLTVDGEEKEVSREEALKFWLPPTDDRSWSIFVSRRAHG